MKLLSTSISSFIYSQHFSTLHDNPIAAMLFYELNFILPDKHCSSYSTMLLPPNLIDIPVVPKRQKELLVHQTKLLLTITPYARFFYKHTKKEAPHT